MAVPRFDRDIEIARAGAIIIERSVRLIVSEGNWLLLEDEPWPMLRPHFDHTALVKAEWEVIEQRNRDRWVGYDFTERVAGFFNVRYLAGGAVGTESNPNPPSDGRSRAGTSS